LVELRAALDTIDRAARAAGVADEDTPGVWIATLKVALESSASVSLESEARIHATLEHCESVVREDRLRMKQATERCTAETQKLEAAFGTLGLRAQHLVTETISNPANQVAEQMHDRMGSSSAGTTGSRYGNVLVCWRQWWSQSSSWGLRRRNTATATLLAS
jgi:hypothetical protein